jgi:predicted Fe-Mo cluster-binding NifX family protein
MKIALPLTATAEFSPHYGAATRFVVFDVDPVHREVRRRLLVEPQASEPCEWPRFLRAAGVELVLAGGMGRGARQHMAEHGVKVFTGVQAAAPDELVTAWLEGRLVASENACDGSGAGAHHHGHHQGAGDAHPHGGCGCSH